jgi:hypothetical protein
MPSRPEALSALQEAAAGWRRAAMAITPRKKTAAALLAWLETRPDQLPPAPLAELDLTCPITTGRRVLLLPPADAALYVRMRLYSGPATAWLPPAPTAQHLSSVNPVELLWDDTLEVRRHRCGALALLQAAAAGDAAALVAILTALGLEAAAALVQQLADDDGLYERASGARVTPRHPSPRQLLQVAFKGRPLELEWLEQLCDGGEHWSAADQMPVPIGQPQRSGEAANAAQWIAKL